MLGAVVVSAGFAEAGAQGRRLQQRLIQHARENGLRIIGPNALGIINTDPRVQLNASLVPSTVPRGRIGFFAQSGALGASLLRQANERGLGVSTFVSAGNPVDVSANDLLQYWEDDDSTSLVLLYLESIGNPRKFAMGGTSAGRSEAHRRGAVGTQLPVPASGAHGQAYRAALRGHRRHVRASGSDAGRLVVGVVRRGQSVDVPDPAKGRRVAVIGNSDALGVLTADACEANGLDVVGDPVLLDHRTD